MLNENNIPFLIIKGGALRLGILSDTPRKMCDVDVVVHPQHLEICKKIAANLGYTYITEYAAIH